MSLVATITPAIADRNVDFGVWDLDDPFDQNNAAMVNVSVIDANRSGPDNRGADPGVGQWTATTDANGVARKTITMSMQPGNNYRGGAAVSSSALTGTTQANADTNSPPQYVMFTPMLTVWRKLHVETDSMGVGSDPSTLMNRNLDATSLEDVHQGPSGGHTYAEIHAWSGVIDQGRLEDGTLTVTGGGTYNIVDNVDDFGDDSVYVEGSIIVDEDKLASATDDDAPFIPRAADTSLMNVKYQPAYIEIQLHPEESQLNIPFVANLTDDAQVVVNTTAPGRSATFLTSPDFWVVQIVTCFQGRENADHDPDDIYHFWTGTDFKRGDPTLYGQTVPDGFSSYDNVSMIFLEAIRDRSAWSMIYGPPPFNETAVLNAGDVERITVVHEVGHVFGISAFPHPPSGLMKSTVEDPNLDFAAAELNTIRNSSAIAQP